MTTFLIIVGSLLMLAALGFSFKPSYLAPILAWGALKMFAWTPVVPVGTWTLVFWGIAGLIVLAIGYLSRGENKYPRIANTYITVGALVGAFVGILISAPGLVLGSVAGAFFGAVAFIRTPRGQKLSYDVNFVTLLAALGLPAVITMCILCLIIGNMLSPVV